MKPWRIMHTIDAHTTMRHRSESKKAMEVFAQLREEVKHLRGINADLLDACRVAERSLTILKEWAVRNQHAIPPVPIYEEVGQLRAAIAQSEEVR